MHPKKKLNSQEIRGRYQSKRRSKKWKQRKIENRKKKKLGINLIGQDPRPLLDHKAPEIFSFINNTNEVLEYFVTAEKLFKKKNKLKLNIDEIEVLTPDAIALLVASINDVDFHHNSGYEGDAPKKPELKKMFKESGFYNFVKSRGFNQVRDGNLLHKEMNIKVKPSIAMKSSQIGIKHTFESDDQYEPLYNILIELMSNTNNHASKTNDFHCKWWLYVYTDPKSKNTSYTFLDLGVGIIDSMEDKGYLNRLYKKSPFYSDKKVVEDLLSGKIQSRIDIDNEIRGKGIPQILGYSKLDEFKEFYIISNKVKINLKSHQFDALQYNFRGTLIHWVIQKS
jgi:hypothetical protein